MNSALLILIWSAVSKEGRCQGDNELHESVGGVEELFWLNKDQIEGRTTEFINPSSTRIETRRPLKIKANMETGPIHTCSSSGQRLTAINGLETVTCQETDVLNTDQIQSLHNSVEEAVIIAEGYLEPCRTDEEGASGVSYPKGITQTIDCSVKNRGTPFLFPMAEESVLSKYDFFLYITATPMPDGLRNSTHAVSWPCYFAPVTHRPTTGIINFNPGKINTISKGYTTQVLLHELFHVLGLYPPLFRSNAGIGLLPTFLNKWFSSTDSNRTQSEKLMYSDVVTTRDRPTKSEAVNFATEGSSTIPDKQTFITTPTILETVKDFYNCSDSLGMEIEDHTFNRVPPAYYAVHWENRISRGDIMSSLLPQDAVVSPFTLAMLHDTGFYHIAKPGQSTKYGRQAGCSFLRESCAMWHTNTEYSCLLQYKKTALLGGACRSGGSECLAKCSDFTSPEKLVKCSGEHKQTENFGFLIPLEYIDRRSYKGDNASFSSAEAARAHGGCDVMQDYCFSWIAERDFSCISTRQEVPSAPPDCWEGKCTEFNEFSKDSRCFLGSLKQQWVDTDQVSPHCLPSMCFTTIFGSQAIEITMGSSTVTCNRKGEKIGPKNTRKPGEFFTFSPEDVSGLYGDIECPDPELFCGQTVPDPPSVPPLYSAPYYQHETAPMENSLPNSVFISRVLINGIRLCGLQQGCEVPMWRDSRIKLTVDGGPFTPVVVSHLVTSLGRDENCAWDGAVPFTLTDVIYNQRLVYNTTLPWWTFGEQKAFLCVFLNGLSVTQATLIPKISFRQIQTGTLTVRTASTPPAIGQPVSFSFDDWSLHDTTGELVYYSFAARLPNGNRMLLKGVSLANTGETIMLPSGMSHIEGRVHLYDGKKVSEWFAREAVNITVSGFGVQDSTQRLTSVIENLIQEVENKIGDKTTTDDTEVVEESLGVVDNLVDVVDEAHAAHAAPSRRLFLVLQNESVASNETFHNTEVRSTTSAAAITHDIVSSMAAIEDATVSAASETLKKYSFNYERVSSTAQDTGITTASTLLKKISVESGLGDQSRVGIHKINEILSAVDNIGVASLADKNFAGTEKIVSGALKDAADTVLTKMKQKGSFDHAERGFRVTGKAIQPNAPVTSLGVTVSPLGNAVPYGCSVTKADPTLFNEPNLTSSVVNTQVRDASDTPPSVPFDVTASLSVDLNQTRYPTVAECEQQRNGKSSVSITRHQVKWRNPATMKWEIIDNGDGGQNLTEYCKKLTDGRGSGWRAKVLSVHNQHIKATQLSEFYMKDKTGTEIPPTMYTVSNPGGSSLPAQTSSAVSDGDVTTAWVDYNQQALIFTFHSHMDGISSYGFAARTEMVFRNPVRWRLDLANDTMNWVHLTGQYSDFQYTPGVYSYWFHIPTGATAFTGGFNQLRLTITKQKNDVFTVVTNKAGEIAAFIYTEVIPTINTEQFSPGTWVHAFENLDETGIRVLVAYGIVYGVMCIVLVVCAYLDSKEEHQDENLGRPLWSPRNARKKSAAVKQLQAGLGNSPTSSVFVPKLSIRRLTTEDPQEMSRIQVGGEESCTAETSCWWKTKQKTREIFTEMKHHTWFTVLFREPHSSYTRTQRVVVLTTFMSSSVFIAILFFGNDNSSTPLKLITTAITASLIMSPTTVVIRLLFQRSNALEAKFSEFKIDQNPMAPIIGELSVYIPEALNFPQLDHNSLPDIFYSIDWENKRFVSSTIWNSIHPKWSHTNTILFPVRDEDEKLSITFFENGLRIEEIGTLSISLIALRMNLIDNGLSITGYERTWYDLELHPNHRKNIPFKEVARALVAMEYTLYNEPLRALPVDSTNANKNSRVHQADARRASWAAGIHPQHTSRSFTTYETTVDETKSKRSIPHDGGSENNKDQTLLEKIKENPATYIKNIVLVIGIHIIVAVLSKQGAVGWALYMVSASLFTTISFFTSFGKILLSSVLSIGTIFLLIAEVTVGVLLLYTECVIVLMAVFGKKHRAVHSVGMTMLTVGLFVLLLYLIVEPPLKVIVLGAVFLVAWALFPCYIIFDYVMDMPFFGMMVYYVMFACIVYTILGQIDWEGKAVSNLTVWVLTGTVGVLGLAAVFFLRTMLRGPLFPPRLPTYCRYIGYVLAIVIQILTVFFSIVFLVENTSSSSPVFNGALWTYWQDIFLNEPIKIIFLSQLGPITKTIMKGGVGKIMKTVLDSTGIGKIVVNLF